jgi:K(+)-stimulated pyrophosphate-energized sodium pump
MGGRIDDAFGGIGPILLPMAIAVLVSYSPLGTLLVKITDENAKEAQVQKSVKYWKLGFWINSLLVTFSSIYVAC